MPIYLDLRWCPKEGTGRNRAKKRPLMCGSLHEIPGSTLFFESIGTYGDVFGSRMHTLAEGSHVDRVRRPHCAAATAGQGIGATSGLPPQFEDASQYTPMASSRGAGVRTPHVPCAFSRESSPTSRDAPGAGHGPVALDGGLRIAKVRAPCGARHAELAAPARGHGRSTPACHLSRKRSRSRGHSSPCRQHDPWARHSPARSHG